jgi:hypothetical protein
MAVSPHLALNVFAVSSMLMSVQQPPTQPRSYSQAYIPNGTPAQASGPVPGATPLLPNQGRVVQAGGARVLCIADVRGEQTVLFAEGKRH